MLIQVEKDLPDMKHIKAVAGYILILSLCLVCAPVSYTHLLLGLRKPEGSSVPEARTEQYYAKRPCAKMVEVAAQIWTEYLEKTSSKRTFFPGIRSK